jgi:hypothetical protein
MNMSKNQSDSDSRVRLFLVLPLARSLGPWFWWRQRVRSRPFDAGGPHQPGDLITSDVVPGPAGGLPQLAAP